MAEVTINLRTLHAGQQKVRDSQARYRVVMCGAQSGKTAFGIDETAEYILAGKSVGWFAPTYKYLRDPWDEVLGRLRPLVTDSNKTEGRCTFATKGKLDLWTGDDPDAGRGRHYDLVVIDEAGIMRNLQVLWEQAIRPRLSTLQGRALFLGTPKGRSHYFTQLFDRAESGQAGWEAFRFRTADNPAQDPAEIEEARRSLPPHVFAQEYEGIPADDGANPFGLDAIRACTVEDRDTLASWAKIEPVAFGWDFARSQDWTVGVGLDPQYRVVRLHRWTGVPWGEQKARIHALNGHVHAWGDATRSRVDDVIVQDLQRLGTPITGVPFSAPTKQALMERLMVCIHERKVQLPAGPLVQELETFQYIYTRHGVQYTAPVGLHDDCVMALALAVYGRDQLGFMVEPAVDERDVPENVHPGLEARYHRQLEALGLVPGNGDGHSRYKPRRMQKL